VVAVPAKGRLYAAPPAPPPEHGKFGLSFASAVLTHRTGRDEVVRILAELEGAGLISLDRDQPTTLDRFEADEAVGRVRTLTDAG